MRSLGYVHRYRGRPVPGDPLSDRDVAIARVQEHLARSLYARGVRIDAEIVASLVVSEYLEVPPWPFQALFD
jgi:hypothetical protein